MVVAGVPATPGRVAVGRGSTTSAEVVPGRGRPARARPPTAAATPTAPAVPVHVRKARRSATPLPGWGIGAAPPAVAAAARRCGLVVGEASEEEREGDAAGHGRAQRGEDGDGVVGEWVAEAGDHADQGDDAERDRPDPRAPARRRAHEGTEGEAHDDDGGDQHRLVGRAEGVDAGAHEAAGGLVDDLAADRPHEGLARVARGREQLADPEGDTGGGDPRQPGEAARSGGSGGGGGGHAPMQHHGPDGNHRPPVLEHSRKSSGRCPTDRSVGYRSTGHRTAPG